MILLENWHLSFIIRVVLSVDLFVVLVAISLECMQNQFMIATACLLAVVPSLTAARLGDHAKLRATSYAHYEYCSGMLYKL